MALNCHSWYQPLAGILRFFFFTLRNFNPNAHCFYVPFQILLVQIFQMWTFTNYYWRFLVYENEKSENILLQCYLLLSVAVYFFYFYMYLNIILHIILKWLLLITKYFNWLIIFAPWSSVDLWRNTNLPSGYIFWNIYLMNEFFQVSLLPGCKYDYWIIHNMPPLLSDFRGNSWDE